MTKFDEVKSKIEFIQKYLEGKSGEDVYGSKQHRFKLNSTLTEAQITNIERYHNIILPPDYRRFLLEIGNGGMGPGYYGLLPLLGHHYFDPKYLSVPFQYTDVWLYNSENVDLDNETDEEFESRMNGAMPIADYGCSLECYLVITGAEAGNMWWDARGTTHEIAPVVDSDGNHLNFLTWYDMWLTPIYNELNNWIQAFQDYQTRKSS